MSLPASLAASLALTLLLELGFALIWGVEARQLPRVALANVLTNPAVVLCHALARRFLPGVLLPATLALEACAVAAEGWLFARRGGIHLPWAFSLCANLFSFSIGILLLYIRRIIL